MFDLNNYKVLIFLICLHNIPRLEKFRTNQERKLQVFQLSI